MAVNRAFAGALKILGERGLDPAVIHHSGWRDFDRVVSEYREKGLQGNIIPFIEDMPGAYRQADIVIGRAGAGSIFELAAAGKPSILIPYPHAANNHQEYNARALAEVRGAEVISQDKLDPGFLADILMKYMDDRGSLREMGLNARKLAKRDASEIIVDQLEEMIMARAGSGK